MRLHTSVVEKLMQIYSIYGGHREETKLVEQLRKLDLSAYTQQANNKETFLVLSEALRPNSK